MTRVTNFNEDEDNQDFLTFKIILLGDSSVGKTSLILRFCDDKFMEIGTSTIGVDTKTKDVIHNGKKIQLEIWDTAGEERFRTLAKNSYQGSDGIILVYDITQKKTFNNIKHWYDNIKNNIDIDKVAIILVGNKSDLPDPQVKKESSEKFCEQYNLQLIETSCKENINVVETFNILIEKMIKLYNDDKKEFKNRASKLDKNTSITKKDKKKCC